MITPQRARELMGGLASGILTAEERQQLFEAALNDQAIFNEVADELEFAAFLQSPETRAQLANRIAVPPVVRRRWWLRPQWIAVCGTVMAALVIAVPVWRIYQRPVPALPLPASHEAADALVKTVLTPSVAAAPEKLIAKAKTAAKQKKVAVLDFTSARADKKSGVQAADVVSQQLAVSGQANMIDRSKVQQAQALEQLGQNQNLTESQIEVAQIEVARNVGQQVGADAVVVGSIEPGGVAGNSFVPGQTVKAQVVDLRKAKSMAKAVASAPTVQRASAMVGSQLQRQMKASKVAGGSVTSVDGETVTVEFTVPWMVHIGDRFDILRADEKLGTFITSSVSGRNAAGKFSGTGTPRAGDRVLSVPEP